MDEWQDPCLKERVVRYDRYGDIVPIPNSFDFSLTRISCSLIGSAAQGNDDIVSK